MTSENITVPDHLQAMRDKETVETQQVCVHSRPHRSVLQYKRP